MWPPREAAAALHGWAREACRATGGRLTRADTIHLTLAFLGDVAEPRLEELKALEIVGSRHFLPIVEARYWPHNRIVWAGPAEMPAPLGRLADDLALSLNSKNFKTEKRQFAAHVTLIRNAHAPDGLPPLPRLRWPVDEVVLVESRPADAGRRYEVLRRYALA
ncbi:MAG TPA: RNA 2',3'-cyclic phosphodiesterase [Burkholderiales bacterium]|nr:RNA 2',3'-cyclic phosphodiesterase [Burkholderiales bacterium]